MMVPTWFRPRSYKHFDVPVGEHYASRLESLSGISSHSWSPLIHYIKKVKRYKPGNGSAAGKTIYKQRDIMYASHRDACLLSKYSAILAKMLESFYDKEGLVSNVIGYRRLGKSNYHFSADAMRFAQAHAPCVVLCFDITGFFDHLNHSILKDRLKRLLEVDELPRGWYEVFRHVTKYSFVERVALSEHPVFGTRLRVKAREPIATVADIKAAGIAINSNGNIYGIPQGTPISSSFSNLYMIDADKEMAVLCHAAGALYQRYSDDIMIICSIEEEAMLCSALLKIVDNHKLEIRDDKKERIVFDPAMPDTYQYLGFNISPRGPSIRPTSLARQWRKLKYSIKKTREIGIDAISAGHASQIFTKRLRKRFYPIGVRNFSSYSRRAGKALGSKRVAKQVARLERAADHAIRELKDYIPVK